MDIRGASTTVPSAGCADLPPGIGFEPKDEPLRRDINLLGRVLGRILIEQEGEDLFETEEEVRLVCRRLRFEYNPEREERLWRRIDVMSVEKLRRIVRAFSV
jgi:phosphoenolpyruvate carboxylase